jgi:hypothetical protein
MLELGFHLHKKDVQMDVIEIILELANKIITKADTYSVEYAGILGEPQLKLKQLEAAKSVDDVISIEW